MLFNVIVPSVVTALFAMPFFVVMVWFLACAAVAVFDDICHTHWENRREKAAIKAARAYQQKMLNARFGKEEN